MNITFATDLIDLPELDQFKRTNATSLDTTIDFDAFRTTSPVSVSQIIEADTVEALTIASPDIAVETTAIADPSVDTIFEAFSAIENALSNEVTDFSISEQFTRFEIINLGVDFYFF